MPITYDSIFGAPTDEEKMRAAANRLRRREAFATLGAFSGDPVLGQWGRGEMGNLREQAQALRKARQEATRLRPTGTPGYMMRGDKIEAIEGYQAAQDAARQQKMELEMFKATQKAQAAASKREQDMADRLAFERAKLEMPTRTQAGAARETFAFLPELQALADQLQNIGEIPTGPETAAAAARELPLSMGEAISAGIERAGMSPEAVDWLARGRQMEQDITRLASGLAVTQAEMASLKKFSPWAGGLTNRERLERLANTANKLGRKAAALQGQEWEPISFSETTVQTPEGSATVTEAQGPEIGLVQDGYRFKGGDPADPANWEQVQ